jgi:hypothetical protein
MGLNGTLVEDSVHSRVNVNIVATTSVPFRHTTVQVPNLSLADTKTDYSAHIQYKHLAHLTQHSQQLPNQLIYKQSQIVNILGSLFHGYSSSWSLPPIE